MRSLTYRVTRSNRRRFHTSANNPATSAHSARCRSGARAGDPGDVGVGDGPGEGAGGWRGDHGGAGHRATLGKLGGEAVGIEAERLEHGVFVADEPFRADLAVLHEAVRHRAGNEAAAGGRPIGPEAGMGSSLEHAVRTDEPHFAALLPHDVLAMAAAAIGEGGEFLHGVRDDLVEIVGLAIGGVDAELRLVVVGKPADGAVDPDHVRPAQDVVARGYGRAHRLRAGAVSPGGPRVFAFECTVCPAGAGLKRQLNPAAKRDNGATCQMRFPPAPAPRPTTSPA